MKQEKAKVLEGEELVLKNKAENEIYDEWQGID